MMGARHLSQLLEVQYDNYLRLAVGCWLNRVVSDKIVNCTF